MSISLVLKGLCSFSMLSGAGMTAMGLGVLPVDEKLWDTAVKVIGENTLPAKPFLVFLGLSKILGVLGLWNKGPFAGNKLLVRAGVGIPPLCAVYGHHQQGDTGGTIAAAVYFAVFVALQIVDGKEATKGKAS